MPVWSWFFIAAAVVVAVTLVLVVIFSAIGRRRVARSKKRPPLTPEAHAKYSEQWLLVQAAFVDDPTGAVDDADRLVSQVMRERGYPIDDDDETDDLAAHYRAAHALRLTQADDDIDTEAQREAFVQYRALFETLLETEAATPKDTRTRQS